MPAYLHHLQIGARDPAALAGFYESAFDMQCRELPDGRHLFAGPERLLLFARGEPKHLDFAAYAFTDGREFAEFRRRLERQEVPLRRSPSPLFGKEAVAVRDPDGNQIVFGHREDVVAPVAALPGAPSGGLPGRLQHLVVASTGCAAMARFYSETLGFTVSDRVFNGDMMTTCFLRSSNEHHSLAVFQASENRLDHHCYESLDWNMIRDWADKFAQLQIPLTWGPGRHGPGNNLFIFINDPEGNWLEISAELEIVQPGRPEGKWPHAERTLNQWGRAPLRS